MKIPKSAIFVAGLSIALFLITLLVISITAQQENAAKLKEEEAKLPVLLEYRPNEKIYLTIKGHNRNESQQTQVVTEDYSIRNGFTEKELFYTRWINLENYYQLRKAEIVNNKLILTSFLYLIDGSVPFLTDEFYIEKGELIHRANIVFRPDTINEKILQEPEVKILKYKHRKHKNITEEEMQDMVGMPDNLLILALCGDKKAIRLLKNRDAYNKYFNMELDGHYEEVYSAAAGAYETYEYLCNQGGSIKEVIPLDK